MKFRINDFTWIFAIGVALVTTSFFELNPLKFVGVIFIVRGLLGLFIKEDKK